MGKTYIKPTPISLTLQKEELRRRYPDLIERIVIKDGCLTCIMKLRPSSWSCDYRIEIAQKIKQQPRVWMMSPQIELYNGKKPHHIYGIDERGYARLCVYYPEYKEWDENTMYLADTFVPWTATWLNTYEYWLVTGVWEYAESPRGIKKKDIAKE